MMGRGKAAIAAATGGGLSPKCPDIRRDWPKPEKIYLLKIWRRNPLLKGITIFTGFGYRLSAIFGEFRPTDEYKNYIKYCSPDGTIFELFVKNNKEL